MALNCPRCGSNIESRPEREWNFQNYHVSRYQCECGDKFNLYSGTTKTFTIPRPFTPKGLCANCKTRNPVQAIFCKNCGTKLQKSAIAYRNITKALPEEHSPSKHARKLT